VVLGGLVVAWIRILARRAAAVFWLSFRHVPARVAVLLVSLVLEEGDMTTALAFYVASLIALLAWGGGYSADTQAALGLLGIAAVLLGAQL
jgi:hypothetical protein